MASAELHRRLTEPMCIARSSAVAMEPAPDRRIHERLNATDVEWLRSARVKYGAAVRVLDISAGGLLIQTERALHPNATVVIELNGPESPILIPCTVLRCRAASVGDILIYEGACAFKRPLTIPKVSVKPAATTSHAAAVSGAHAAASRVRWRKVVAQLSDGRVVCGYTSDFHPSKTHLHLSPHLQDGEITVMPLSQLKALFFVREFTDDPTLVEPKFFSETQGGKMEVTFCDNEVVVESTLSYRTERHGFFLRPADPTSNYLGVFVTIAGMQQVRFLLTEDRVW